MKYIFTLLTLTVSLFLKAQDGVLDNNWGTGSSGTVINQVSGVVTSTNRMRMIILPSKKILQTFTVSNGTNTDFGLARFNEDGSLDVSFGGSSTGYITTDFGGDDYATCLALQSDGKIVVAGYKV